MKKLLLKVLVVLFALGICLGGFAGCTGRADTLKIYNWNEYIDPTVVKEFQSWYQQETGKKIKVVYGTYESNEDLFRNLELGDDWDVVCPSDYMIDRMINSTDKSGNPMLQKIDPSVIDIFNDVGNKQIKNMMDEFTNPVNEYSVPYIWGTFGIMYDTNRISAEQAEKLQSWKALFEHPEFAGNIYMKTQVRDSYSAAMLYSRADDLLAAAWDEEAGEYDYMRDDYRALLSSLFQDFDTPKFNEGMNVLRNQFNRVKLYEGDMGKFAMASEEQGSGSLGLFWSCDAGYVMSDLEEEPSFFSCSSEPVLVPGNKNLGYIVPKEGSNVWFDSWVIPHNAVNTEAANKWIEFTLKYEIATLNAEYAGSPSANADAMNDLRDEYEKDDEFFAGANDPVAFKKMYMEARFPSDETLERCAVMADFGSLYNNFYQEFEKIKIGQ